MRRHRASLGSLILIALILAACLRGRPPGRGEDVLVYSGPTEIALASGERLMPTDIVFQGAEDGRGRFLIGEYRATRQIGDSLDWDGEPLPGVSLRLRLRVLWLREDQARLAGTVRVEVRGVEARAGRPADEAPVVYRLPVAYRVPKGAFIPGTTWEYRGPTERGAELGGIEEYPYRKIADSILWEGWLRPQVGLTLNLRVVYFDEQALQVAGLATILLDTSG